MSDWEAFLAESEATQVAMLTDTLQAIAAEVGPEYCYDRDRYVVCKYVADDHTPACLVGVALHRLGMPIEELRRWDKSEDGAISLVGHEILPNRAVALLDAAQQVQDGGGSWALAVERAMDQASV